MILIFHNTEVLSSISPHLKVVMQRKKGSMATGVIQKSSFIVAFLRVSI